MKNRINHYIFSQTRFKSSSLTQLGFVVHQFNDNGLYHAEVSRHGKPVYSFQIDVSKHNKEMQLSLDLEKLNPTSKKATTKADPCKCSCENTDQTFELNEGGYGLFYVGSGSGGYSVLTTPLNRKDKDVFDSTALGNDDLFGITLLRPGQYTLIENSQDIKIGLEVEAAKAGNKAYTPPEPVHLEAKNLKKSKNVKLKSAQGLIYKASGKDNITIELIKPADKETDKKDSKVAHWNKVSSERKGGSKGNK